MIDATDPVLIVGAGMSGLTAAGELARHGIASIVLDKGRAAGGRMATRRVGGSTFDHGAQHFSARSDTFRRTVDGWQRAGVVAEWFRSKSSTMPERGIEPRFSGVGGMRRIPEYLASTLDVRTAITVERLVTSTSEISAMAGQTVLARGSAAILTPPIPQVLPLLEASAIDLPNEDARDLTALEYDACLAVMAQLDGPSGLPDGHLAVANGAVAWLADNEHKGVSPGSAVTIHSSADFASAYLEDHVDTWADALCRAAEPHLAGTIIAATGHRWRYAMPRTTLEVGSMVVADSPPVVLAGEIFAGAKVEGAFLSGMSAARAVRGML